MPLPFFAACAQPAAADAGQPQPATPQASAPQVTDVRTNAAPAPSESVRTETARVQEIVVTGSRVARAGYAAPSPTTVIGTELLRDNGAAQVADVLNSLPAFKADFSAANTGPRSFGNPGAAFANLRSLGSVRTLTLVDGRRVVPSATSGQVDLNIIPTILIDHVDVVTGGSSAAYGSDAVAGVLNFVLKRNFTGFTSDMSYQQSRYNDAKEMRLSAAAGLAFADDRGHLTIGGEYVDNHGAKTSYSRPWGRKEYGILTNPCPAGIAISATCPTGTNGLASQLVVQDYRASNIAPGGLVVSGPLRGLQFLPGGQTSAFQYGSLVGSSFMVGGEGYGTTYAVARLLAPLERYNGLAHVDYEVADALSLYAEAAYASSHTVTRGGQPRDTTPFTVQRTNPFLPPAVVARMVAAGVTTLSVGRNNYDLGFSENDAQTRVQRYVIGAKGDIGGGWSWDAYAQVGRTSYQGDIINARLNPNFTAAIDAVVNPATGQIVCRSTLPGAAPVANAQPGCIPANIFGSGSISEAARAYVMGNQTYHLVYKQKVAAATLRGSPFSTWAGKVSLAGGVEFRSEQARGAGDPLSQAGLFNLGNQKAISGRINVREFFAEAVTPLLADSPVAKLLELDTAVRQTHYSTSGSVTTWKVGVNYVLSDDIRIRATRSRDIRAANISELYTNAQQSNQTVINPLNQQSILGTPTLASGNPNLKPEKADTYTVGVVLRPSFVPRFNISIDYYDIDVADAISSLTFQQIVNLCLLGANTDLCQYVDRNAAGAITTVRVPTVNVAHLHTAGIDFEARYQLPLNEISDSLPGDVTFRLIGTYVRKIVADNGVLVVDRVGELGNSVTNVFNVPRWRVSYFTTFASGPFRLTATARFISKGKFENTYVEFGQPAAAGITTINDNSLPSRTYFDLSGQYDLVRNGRNSVQLYGVVTNLFNRAPPPAPGQTLPVNAAIYDVVGRLFRVGVRVGF